MSDDSFKPVPDIAAPEAPAKGKKRFAWSVPAAVGVVLFGEVATQVVAALLVGLYPLFMGWDASTRQDWMSNSPTANFFMILVFEILAVSVVAIFVHYRKVAFAVAALLRKPKWKDLWFGLLGFMVYFGAYFIVLLIVQALTPINTGQQQDTGFQHNVTGSGLWMAFAGLVILPPIAEEIVFRGFLYGTMRANKIRAVWSAVITSVIFASLHLFGSDHGLLWIAFVDTFVLSNVLCWVREETDSILAGMLIHALKNGFVFLNLFVIGAH